VSPRTTTARRYGSGSLTRRNGGWLYRVMLDGKQRSFSGATAAVALAGPERAANRAASAPAPVAATLGAFLTGWLADSRQTRKPQTWRKYDSIIRTHVLPTLGDVPLAAVTPQHLTDLYAAVAADGLGATSVRHVHVVLGTGLQAATRRGLIPANPSRMVDAPRVDPGNRPTLSRGQVARLLAAVKGDRLEALYVLAVTTGMRQGELLALRWSDVALDPGRDSTGRLTIAGSMARGLDGVALRASPKTRAARRIIRLPRVAVTALRALGRGHVGSNWIFPVQPGGGPLSATELRRHFGATLAAAGLPAVHFHDLRHTAATSMLEDGVQAHVVARILGHASVAITLSLYGHVTPGMTDSATAAMDARYPA
jgi:integrase